MVKFPRAAVKDDTADFLFPGPLSPLHGGLREKSRTKGGGGDLYMPPDFAR